MGMRYRCTKCYNFINRYARDKNGIETQGICQKCWESAGIIELAEPNKKEFIVFLALETPYFSRGRKKALQYNIF